MLRLFVVLLILACAGGAARAEVFLENLTWVELRDAISAGDRTVLVPIGGTEQSGPHLALGKHNARVRVLAEKIATRLGHTLVAPVVAYVPEGAIDPPTEHMRFPGTLSLSDATFMAMLQDTARSLRHAGFANIVFLGDHGGYQRDLTQAADALNRTWKGNGRVIALREYYAITQSGYVQALRAAGVAQSEIGSHAGLADTSLELATAPDMVRKDLLTDPASAQPANGVYGGNPARSSAAFGQKGVDLIVDGAVAALQKILGEH